MPHIKKSYVRAKSDNGVEAYHDINIKYDQRNGFYAEVPETYGARFDALSEDLRKKMHASAKQITNYESKGRIINGTGEEDVENNMRDLIKYFLDNNETTRNVIVVWLDRHHKDAEDRKTVNNFPEIKLSIKFQYLEETRYGTDKAVYNLRRGENFERIRDVEKGWRGSDRVMILDDTPVVRAFLEQIYGALGILITKIFSISNSEKSLLEFIDTKQKLLS